MLFISHASDDRAFVQRLAIDLLNRDVDVWLDGWELELGDELSPRIRDAVEHGDCLLLVLSPAALQSPWVDLEVTTALKREQILGRTLLIPIRIAPCHPPDPVAGRLFADFTTGYNAAFERLSEQLSDRLEDTPPPLPERELLPLRFHGPYELDSSQLSARLDAVLSRLPAGFALSPRQFVFSHDPRLEDAWMRLYRRLDQLEADAANAKGARAPLAFADPAADARAAIKLRDTIQRVKQVERWLVEGLLMLVNEVGSSSSPFCSLPSACAIHARLCRHSLLGALWETQRRHVDDPSDYGSDAVSPAFGTTDTGAVLPLAQLRRIDVYQLPMYGYQTGPAFLFKALLDAQSTVVQALDRAEAGFLTLSEVEMWMMWEVLAVQAVQRRLYGAKAASWDFAPVRLALAISPD